MLLREEIAVDECLRRPEWCPVENTLPLKIARPRMARSYVPLLQRVIIHFSDRRLNASSAAALHTADNTGPALNL